MDKRPDLLAALHNSGWVVLDKLARLSFALLVGTWVVRYLGPAQFGELAYAIAVIAFFQAIANLGMDGIVVRDIAKSPSSSSRILGTAFLIRTGAGAACWLAAVLSSGWFYGWYDRTTWIVAIVGGSLIFQAADTVDLWFQSQTKSKFAVLAKLGGYLVTNGVRVVMIKIDAPLLAFGVAFLIEALLSATALALAYRRFPSDGRWQYSHELAKDLIKESWPFLLSGLSIMVYMRIDQIMVKEFLGEKALGLYAAVLQVSSLWHVIPMALSISFAPMIARRRQDGEAAYYRALASIFRVFLVISVALSFVTMALSHQIVALLFGPQYAGAGEILAIHVFTNIAIFLGVAQSLWLVNERKSRIALQKTVIGGVCSVGLNLLLLPAFGLAGAAVSAVVAHTASAVLSNIFYSRRILKMQLGLGG